MGIGPHQRVGVGQEATVHLAGVYQWREVLQVDLVHDARARWYHTHVVKGALAPFQEAVALLIALELPLHVVFEGAQQPVGVNLHRMVDHEVGRHQRIDGRGIFTKLRSPVAHGRQVDQCRDPREVL